MRFLLACLLFTISDGFLSPVRIRYSSSLDAVHIIDGPHWKSLQKFYDFEKGDAASLSIKISGRTMRLEGTDFEVSIPPGVSDTQAEATLVNALAIHAALPVVKDVGGSSTSVVSGRVVIIGGSKQAKALANALEELDVTVTIVSSKPGASIDPTKDDFSEKMDTFYSMVDTIGDETQQTGILKMLNERHDCERYISTVSKAQTIVSKEGLLWGPGKAGEYMDKLRKAVPKTSIKQLPPSFKETVERLLEKQCIFPAKKDSIEIPGWSLTDAMELNMWPMDKWGTNMIRYGFPVREKETFYDEDEKVMMAVPPSRGPGILDEPEEKPIPGDPVILIEGVKGLEAKIIREKRDCVLFVKAPYCRTCRKLMPRFRQMAKTDKFTYAQADATGLAGKELGRALGVRAVPAFVFFRDGKRYGEPLGITKLPNQKLKVAMELLKSGKEWDHEMISKAEK